MNTINELMKQGIRDYMESSGATEKDIATRMDVSEEMVRYFLNEHSYTASWTLDKFCEAFHLEPLLVLRPRTVEIAAS